MDKYIKNALITGAGKRIGSAVANSLSSEGWNLALHYNKSENTTYKLAEKLNRIYGNKIICVKANLEEYNQIKNIFSKIDKKLGTLSCLINNAAVFQYDSLRSTNLKKWDIHINTNIRAPLFLSQSFSKRLPPNQKGNIINIIDQRVLNLTPHFLTYTLSKSTLWTLTQTLALSLAPNIRVNAIGPGPTMRSSRQTQKQFVAQCKRMPLKRGAEPKEIGNLVKVILNTPSITGQIIVVDGGQHLGWSQSATNNFHEE